MIKVIIGVPGSGKTTYLANMYKNEGWSINFDTLITGVTNATVKAFLTKIGLKEKQYGARTIYGLAYMELYKNGLLTENEIKMLDNKEIFKYLQYLSKRVGYKITPRTLEIINNVFLKSILKYGRSNRWYEFSGMLSVHRIPKRLAHIVYRDYKKGKYFNYVFLLERALKERLNFFNIYQYRPFEDKVITREPLRIIIDEFQDFPEILTKMILDLDIDKIYFAGDPAQEIFSFLESNPKLILDIDRKKTYLTKTFRFGKNITSLANEILKEIGYDYRIVPYERRDIAKISKFNKSFLISLVYALYTNEYIKDIIVLARTRSQVYNLFRFLSKKFPTINLEKYEYEKLNLLLQLIKKYKEGKLLSLMMNKKIIDFFEPQSKLLMKILRREGFTREYLELAKKLLESKKWVMVSTIHNVKGLEFDAVILYNQRSKLIDRLIANRGRRKYLEELRVVYTGITRAKKVLIILNGDDPIYY